LDFKDYYAVLGVEPGADAQAIKQVYRSLARKHHPDVKPGDKQAEDRFKEINEAYQALGDPERRRKYDDLRKQYEAWREHGGRGEFDWGRWQAPPGHGSQTYTVSPEDLEDLFGSGGSPFSDFFGSIFGEGGGWPRGGERKPRPRRGQDQEAEVEITLEEAFRGTTRTIQIGDRRIDARIPPGVRSGSRVRLAGQGSPGQAGGSAGDLYLVVEVAPHTALTREGDDVRAEVRVDFYTAALGGETRVPTIDGAVTLKIPPRTQADKKFRLKGKGMPRLGRPGERGDMWVRVRLALPETMSEDEIEALGKLAERRKTQGVGR
jgi:curved DNA-binding protein